MEPDREEQVFFLDNFEGKASGGYYIRNDLFKFIKRIEAEGKKVVGIGFDGTWNLNIIVEVPPANKVN